jgi:hypothetical protein
MKGTTEQETKILCRSRKQNRMYVFLPSLATIISPSQPNLSLVAPEAMLRDLTEYITKTGEFADARGGFGEIWKCILQVDQGPINVCLQCSFYPLV